MKNFNFTKVNQLTNESVAMLSYRIIETIANSDSEQAKSGKQYVKHAEISQQFQQLVEPNNKQDQTKAIDECYNTRRELFNSMYVYVFGLQSSPNTDTAQAAQQIFTALNMYGKYFGSMKIAEQSLRYVRIIEALRKPELAAMLQKTQLTDNVTALDAVQRKYEDLFMGRSNNRLGAVSASSMRKELNACIRLHVEELNWMALQTESETLKMLCASVDARIREVNLSAQRSKADVQADTESRQTA